MATSPPPAGHRGGRPRPVVRARGRCARTCAAPWGVQLSGRVGVREAGRGWEGGHAHRQGSGRESERCVHTQVAVNDWARTCDPGQSLAAVLRTAAAVRVRRRHPCPLSTPRSHTARQVSSLLSVGAQREGVQRRGREEGRQKRRKCCLAAEGSIIGGRPSTNPPLPPKAPSPSSTPRPRCVQIGCVANCMGARGGGASNRALPPRLSCLTRPHTRSTKNNWRAAQRIKSQGTARPRPAPRAHWWYRGRR